MTLWAQPTVVVGTTQTLFPTLPFPLEQVMRGVVADEESVVTTFGEGVVETGAWNKAKG